MRIPLAFLVTIFTIPVWAQQSNSVPNSILELPELTEESDESPAAEENPAPVLLPEGISEEDAKWANWNDWDKVDVKQSPQNEAKKQELIAPKTSEDEVQEQSQLLEQSVVPNINPLLNTQQYKVITEPEISFSEGEASETKRPHINDSARKSEVNLPAIPESTANSSGQQDKIAPEILNLVNSQTPPTTEYSNKGEQTTAEFYRPQEPFAPINPQIKNLIEEIKKTRRYYFDKKLNMDNNSPYEALMSVCAFGCFSSMIYPESQMDFNTVGALCWNYPMGETPVLGMILESNRPSEWGTPSLSPPTENPPRVFSAVYPQNRQVQISLSSSGRIFPLVGYCQQEREGEFLSILATSRVGASYKFKPRPYFFEEDANGMPLKPANSLPRTAEFTVADLVEHQMLNCNGGNMSAILPALSYYVPRERWTNHWGQPWSVLRITDHELKREVNLADSDSTDRLFGLTYSLRRRLAFRDQPLEKTYIVLDDYLQRMQEFALSLQNEDGSWHGAYFTRKGKSKSTEDDFAASANFTRWLVILYSNSRFNDPRLTRAVEFLVRELNAHLERYNPAEMSQRDTRAIAYALQAIALYQQRWSHSVEKSEP